MKLIALKLPIPLIPLKLPPGLCIACIPGIPPGPPIPPGLFIPPKPEGIWGIPEGMFPLGICPPISVEVDVGCTPSGSAGGSPLGISPEGISGILDEGMFPPGIIIPGKLLCIPEKLVIPPIPGICI